MGEPAVADEVPPRHGFFADRSLAAWGILLAVLSALVVLALLFSPSGADTNGAETPFALSHDLEPFLTLTVGRASALAAALALSLAALLVTIRLEIRVGRFAPLWVAVFIVGAVVPQATLWTPGAVILAAATAIAFTLAQGGAPPPRQHMPDIWDAAGSTRGFTGLGRWLTVGALLGAVGASHPIYLGLLVPAALSAPALGAKRARWSLTIGAAAALAGGLALGGIGRWLESVGPLVLAPKLAGWNLLYFFAGRQVGVLICFVPLLLMLAAADDERGRVALGIAVMALGAAFALLRPFDFFGGPSAIGNRFFLPLYGAAWLLPAKRARAWPAVLVAALAGAVLWPLWLRPLASPLTEQGTLRYAHGPLAERLPYEMTQRDLPGARDVVHHGLRMRFPDARIWPAARGESLRLMGGTRGEMVFAAGPPLGSMLLEFSGGASPRLELEGGELGEMILRPDGGIAYVVTFSKPSAVMPGWWTKDPVHWYRLALRFADAPAAPVSFSIAPQRKPAARVVQ